MREEKGITLIALILTVIIMVILAGISFNALTGENGIITNAMGASQKHKNGTAKEELEFAWTARMSRFYEDLASGKATYDDLDKYFSKKELNQILGATGKIKSIKYDSESGLYTIHYQSNTTGQTYESQVTKQGEIENLTNIEEKDYYTEDIYIFYYADDRTLVFNNKNEGLVEKIATQSWSVDDWYSDPEWFPHVIYEDGDEAIDRDVENGIYTNIEEVIFLNEIYPKETSDWFYGFTNLTTIENIEYLKTENVTNMYEMFSYCGSLKNLDVSDFDTSNVKNMSAMFYNCDKLTSIVLSSFNTSKVTDMSYMFSDCKSLTELDLSNFNTSKVRDMTGIVSGCSTLSDLNLSGFDLTRIAQEWQEYDYEEEGEVIHEWEFVSGIDFMFDECENLKKLTLDNFKTSTLTNMSNLFAGCKSLTNLDLSSFKTSNVTDMSGMFAECSSLTELDLSSFKTSNVTDMSGMFAGCSSLTELDLSSFKTSNVTDMSGMFAECSSLTELDLSSFDTSGVESMRDMFHGCKKLTALDLSNFNTKEVRDADGLFSGCKKLNKIYISDDWVLPIVFEDETEDGIFYDCGTNKFTRKNQNGSETQLSLEEVVVDYENDDDDDE